MKLQYKNPPSNDELVEIMKRAFANMGYDTPEKRKEWYEKNCKPVAILCTRMKGDFDVK